jgi:hypothetical protein
MRNSRNIYGTMISLESCGWRKLMIELIALHVQPWDGWFNPLVVCYKWKNTKRDTDTSFVDYQTWTMTIHQLSRGHGTLRPA